MWEPVNTCPDWRDEGRLVRAIMGPFEGRVEIVGWLEVADFFPTSEGDEVPVFDIVCDDGRRYSFASAERWRYESDRLTAPN